MVKTYLDFARPRTNSRLFLFLDEISFVTDWQKSIKEMVDAGLLKNARKNKKIYFTDPFIFNTLFLKTNDKFENPFAQSANLIKDPHYLSAIAENLVASHLKRKSSSLFWGKTAKGEIDLAVKKGGRLDLFEVKYKEKIDYSEIPSVSPLTVISKKHLAEKPIKTLPLEIFLLRVGNFGRL